MPFIPHTAAEAQVMLSAIGVDAIDDLFDEIPAGLKNEELSGLSAGLSEMEMLAAMQARADADPSSVCFLGAGAYDHHIPAAVWDLTSRGEFMTAYTPYQAEASQGTLQLIYEYQTTSPHWMCPMRQCTTVRRGWPRPSSWLCGPIRRRVLAGCCCQRAFTRTIVRRRATYAGTRASTLWTCRLPTMDE